MEHRLAEQREKRGIRQADLASRIGISRGQLANLESGTRTVDLPTLRKVAKELGLTVADLLLPEDAPGAPSEAETALLTELRQSPGYDPRLVLVAARGVIDAARSVLAVQAAPADLEGDPVMVAAFAERWNGADEQGRKQIMALSDTVREFARK